MANTIEVGSKWVNRKTGKVCIVSGINDKFKTLEYYPEEMSQLDENKRKTTSTNWVTFRKSWKAVEDAKQEAPKEVKQTADKKQEDAPKLEDKKQDKKDVSRETPKKEDAPKDKKPRKKREVSPAVLDMKSNIFDYMKSAGGSVGGNREESMTFRALRHANGRQICKLMWTTKAIKLYFRCADVMDLGTDTVICEEVNYSLPYRATIEAPTSKDWNVVQRMLKAAYADETERQSRKDAKKNKKSEGDKTPSTKSKKGEK